MMGLELATMYQIFLATQPPATPDTHISPNPLATQPPATPNTHISSNPLVTSLPERAGLMPHSEPGG